MASSQAPADHAPQAHDTTKAAKVPR